MKKYYDYFKSMQHKVTGKWIYSVVKGTPQKLTDFILYIHEAFDCGFPNDWIYEVIADAFRDFQIDEVSLADFIGQVQVDPYDRDLIEWLKESYAAEYCNEVIRDCNEVIREGLCDEWGIMQLIAQGQWKAKIDIYQLVALFLSDIENVEETNEE